MKYITILFLLLFSINSNSKNYKGKITEFQIETLNKQGFEEWHNISPLQFEINEADKTCQIYFEQEILTFVNLQKISNYTNIKVYKGFEYTTGEKYIITFNIYQSCGILTLKNSDNYSTKYRIKWKQK